MLSLNSRKMPRESEQNKENQIITVMDGMEADTGLVRHMAQWLLLSSQLWIKMAPIRAQS